MVVPGDEPSEFVLLLRTQTPAIGVQSDVSWPCGQDSHPKPVCRRRRVLRYEARSVGYWF